MTAVADSVGTQQGLVHPQHGQQVDVDNRGPPGRVRVGEQLVPGDARVVHDDIKAAVPGVGVCRDLFPSIGGRHIELQGRPADSVRHCAQGFTGGSHVNAHDGCTVAGHDGGDLGADPSGGAGDHNNLAGERTVPVRGAGNWRGTARGTDLDDLSGDVG